MQHKEHPVINKASVILIILIMLITNVFAQQQKLTEPEFIYKQADKDRMISLNYFLSVPEKMPLPDCLSAFGTLRFRISKRGLVDSINVSGNLPDTLVKAIKKRIIMTNGYWKFNSSEGKLSKWFVYPILIEHSGNRGCENKNNSYFFLTQLFDKNTLIINTPTSYLIKPNIYSLIY